ncbi:hypothetical protein L873DRAFT_1832923 [Choiromyces venosus 120613-1]|uniref:Uncharacterized protein n=1 Tax=Choiromyces venosus 120613-1 TaxID=1336337 RepID=A0A3N4K7H7_9PEZI|nr:hypothetical protein L873DRAFT_1832923 [Choiromyces venosus 120613-1]
MCTSRSFSVTGGSYRAVLNITSLAAGFLHVDFSLREKIWVYTRLAQAFLSGLLVIKTLLHFMCGWSPSIYPIIITNGVILTYVCLSLHLHRKRVLIRQFPFWSVNALMDWAGFVGCIATACACSLSDHLRGGLCGNSWGYCSNRGFHIVWMSFSSIAFGLTTVLCFWISFVAGEGRIALPDDEDSSIYQPVRSSSIAALAVTVPGTRSMNPDTVIQGAVDYINSMQRDTRMHGAGESKSGWAGEPRNGSTTVAVPAAAPTPDLTAQLDAIMARIEAMERNNEGKE